MRRIRIVFLLLAVALLGPMWLFLERALASVALEKEARHRTVAERVFDEMERELTRLVEDEEARPFGHYRFYYVPESISQASIAVARSPLAAASASAYVVGYFQIDPDGSFHSPLLPRDRALARRHGDWSPSSGPVRIRAQLERIVLAGVVAEVVEAQEPLPFALAPGTSKVLERPGDAAAAGSALAEEEGAPSEVDAYVALRSLNRSAKARDERRLPVRLSPRGFGADGRLRYHAEIADAASANAVRQQAGLSPSGWLSESMDSRDPTDARMATFFDPDLVLAGQRPEGRKVSLYPMVGRVVDNQHLLVYRMATVGSDRYRQGFAIDVQELTRWLDGSVLGGEDLSRYSSREFFLQRMDPTPRDVPNAFVYLHRFAEPFEQLAIRLTLLRLPDVGGASYLYTIAVLLMLLGTLGLYALYRMVAVVVGFAERRSNFAAAVSHELKTPLTAIRMHAEMLRDGLVPTPEKQREHASTITDESERLTRLINNVLEFSRLEQGTREMSLLKGPIVPVVEEAVRILEPHARNNGFTLQVEMADGLPHVSYEHDAVLQILFNLVDNAIKYSRGAGEPVVTLRCTRDGDAVVLAVRDRGPGVPERHLKRVFQPFYRGESELTRSAKGTGIGLALVRTLAERMGARVLGSNPPEGGFEVALRFRPASGSQL
jgi:signal transduction histidine kinase